MTIPEFVASNGQSYGGALRALWLVSRGEWEMAHEAAQADEGPDGAWVHAYLHRVEGDLTNAKYWYRQADRPAQSCAIASEWNAITEELLARCK